jgi:hypothetical protein
MLVKPLVKTERTTYPLGRQNGYEPRHAFRWTGRHCWTKLQHIDVALLLNDKLVLTAAVFVEMVIWQVPQPVRNSSHSFKYRLALIANGVCVLRFDNEAAKGDHVHIDERELPYDFIDLTTLQTDFWAGVTKWRRA